MILLNRNRSLLLLAASVALSTTTEAFVRPSSTRTTQSRSTASNHQLISQNAFLPRSLSSRPPVSYTASGKTRLFMAADDFDQQKYTEAAWSAMMSLAKVAEYYEASAVEAPMLMEALLNPSKYGGSDDAEAAKRVADKLLTASGVDVKMLKKSLERHLGSQPKITVSGGGGQKTMGQSLGPVLETARQNQNILGDSFVSVESLLLALAKEDSKFTTGEIAKQGVKYTDILDATKKAREKSGPAISRSAENMYDALTKYGVDFTEQAEEGKLDPVIGRDDEIRRAIQILSRRR